MSVLTALADATPASLLVALAAFFAAHSGGQLPLPPTAVGVVAGVAVLAGTTGVSLRFQTEDRRFPVTWTVLDLLA